MKQTKASLLPYLICSILLSILCFYSYATDDNSSKTEEVKVIFKNYNIINQSKGQDHYSIETEKDTYSIPQIYIASFNQKLFKNLVIKNDTLHITKALDSKAILQLKSKTVLFIDEESRDKQLENNTYLALILGGIFTLTSLLLLYKTYKS